MKEHTIVTISRQYGSGGREIAEILAKKMQVRCYDRQIVYLAAEKVGNADLDIENILEEAYKVPTGHSQFFGGFGIGSDVIPDYNKMYKEQAALIRKLAEKSGGVFLGRCADAVLSDVKNCYHIFIYADDDFREKRSKEAYDGISLKEMDREDVSRQRYYNYYTGRTWGNPLNYDLMLNTSHIELEDAADMILAYIEKVQNR
nr:cytidylate kinase-like family protein [uncultured Dorea sp.]